MLPRESNGRARGIWIVTENVTKDFVENFGLNGLLDKMLGALLQSGKNVFLVADEEDQVVRRVGVWRTMRSTASMPSIWGMVMSMRTMSGLMRLNSAMAVRPSPASPATSPPKISIIFMMFLRAKTESSTTR